MAWKNRCESFTLKGTRCKKNKSDEHCCTIHKDKIIIEPELCSICLEEPVNKINLICKHNFCKECIYKWLCICTKDFNCPMCRNYITDIELKNNAWMYGERTGILFRIKIFVHTTDSLLFKEHVILSPIMGVYLNNALKPEEFFLLTCVMVDDLKIIFNKILASCVVHEMLVPVSDDRPKPAKESYFIRHKLI